MDLLAPVSQALAGAPGWASAAAFAWGVLSIWLSPSPKRRGPGMALVLGAAFGFALGPCAFAWIAPVLGAAWLGATGGLLAPALLLALFAAGHCAGVWLAADSLDRVQRRLDRFERWSGLRYGRFACGGLLLVGGGYLLAAA